MIDIAALRDCARIGYCLYPMGRVSVLQLGQVEAYKASTSHCVMPVVSSHHGTKRTSRCGRNVVVMALVWIFVPAYFFHVRCDQGSCKSAKEENKEEQACVILHIGTTFVCFHTVHSAPAT